MAYNHRYPPNWRHIAETIKERAGWRCQHCGAEQHDVFLGVVKRRPFEIRLAVAHLDHDPENIDARLAVLCQPCHMRHDKYEHAINGWKTRRARRRADAYIAGQLVLF